MEKRTDLTCIIVTYRKENIGRYAFRNIELLRRFHIDAVVADNGGNEPLEGCRFISMKGNEGYGKAVNEAMKHVETPYALIMNDDITLTDEFLGGLLRSMPEYEKGMYSAVGFHVLSGKTRRTGISMFNYSPLIVMYHFSPLPHLLGIFSSGRRDRSLFETIHYSKSSKRVKNLSGAIFMVRVGDFRRAGGFDPSIFLTYEETDLFRRMMMKGGKLYYDSERRVAHEHTYTASKESAGESFVSMRYYMRKHFSKPVALALDVWVFSFLLFARIVTFNRKRGDFDAFVRAI